MIMPGFDRQLTGLRVAFQRTGRCAISDHLQTVRNRYDPRDHQSHLFGLGKDFEAVTTTAILDRLSMNGRFITLEGRSYRRKN
jgi:hypothetical protein